MNDSSRTVYELDSSSITKLLEIMDHGYPQVSGYARGLLVNGNYIEFIEDVATANSYKSSKIHGTGYIKQNNVKNDNIKLFPNPSTDYTVADFNTNEFNHYGEILVVDLTGKICKKINLVNRQDQIVINLENLTSGTYIVLLQVDNKTVASTKFVKINE